MQRPQLAVASQGRQHAIAACVCHMQAPSAILPAGSRRRLRQDEHAAGSSSGSGGTGSTHTAAPVPVRMPAQPLPAWLAEDPVWQAAAEGQRTLGRGGSDGPSFMQAPQAEAEAYAQAPTSSSDGDAGAQAGAAPAPEGAGGLPGTAGRAAVNTIAAWCVPPLPASLPGSRTCFAYASLPCPAQSPASSPQPSQARLCLPAPTRLQDLRRQMVDSS